ncbi:MAG: hypothetical protein AB9869_34855 [Verrucomicrobiia bacterium]
MRLSETVKGTMSHRLYQVVFWTFIVLSFSVGAVSFLAMQRWSWRSLELLRSQEGLLGTSEFDIWLDTLGSFNRLGEIHGTIVATCCAALLLLPLIAIAYRLLLYIRHGKAAFLRWAPVGPRRTDDPQGEMAGDTSDPYRVLGISRSAPFDDIQ